MIREITKEVFDTINNHIAPRTFGFYDDENDKYFYNEEFLDRFKSAIPPLDIEAIYQSLTGKDIHEETVEEKDSGISRMTPVVECIEPSFSDLGVSESFHIKGGNFDKNTSIVIEGETIPFTLNNHESITFEYTTSEVKTYEIKVKNEESECIINIEGHPAPLPWFDCREGGFDFSNVQIGSVPHHKDATKYNPLVVRDPEGQYCSKSYRFKSWIKYNDLSFTRGSDKKVSFVFKTKNRMWMVGIGSDQMDNTSRYPFYEAECMVYIFKNQIRGFYGGGPGNKDRKMFRINGIDKEKTYKITIEKDGNGLITLSEVDASDFEKNIKVLGSFETGNDASSANLFPMILPDKGKEAKLIAVRVE